MNIVTGYVGQPHITANEAQALNQGIFGSGNYVLDVGNKFAATLESATSVAVQDGEGVIQGVQFRIAPGDVESVTISPGTTGYKRIDYICARYTKNAITGVEDVSLVVVEGTPDASTPTAPTINTGDVLTGSSPVDFALWEVDLDGLTPTLKTLIPSNHPSINTVGDIYDLPFTKSSGSGITNNTKLYVIPSIKLMIIDIDLSYTSSYGAGGYVGQYFPVYYGTESFFYKSVYNPVVVIENDTPKFASAKLETSRVEGHADDSELNISGGTAQVARRYVGQIIAPYERLNARYPLSLGTKL